MVHYSVLIPSRDASEAIGRRLPQLCRVLDGLLLPYEIICIDDASAPAAAEDLCELLAVCAPLRVLRFDEPRGRGAALTAGLAAARGDLVIAVDPAALDLAYYLPHLVARLSRHDLVVARRWRSLRDAWWQQMTRVPRLIAAGKRWPFGDELLWAARRSAVAGLGLQRGAFRILEKLVAERGLRVCRLVLSPELPPAGAAYRAGLVDRLASLWLRRRYEPHLASEMARSDRRRPHAETAGRAGTHDAPRPAFTPLNSHLGDSA